jgi:hypothetical protein
MPVPFAPTTPLATETVCCVAVAEGAEPLMVEVCVARTTVLVIVVVDVEVVVPDDSDDPADTRGANKKNSPAAMCEQRMVAIELYVY